MTTDTPKLARGIGPVGLLFSAIGAIIGSGWLFAGLYAAEAAGPERCTPRASAPAR